MSNIFDIKRFWNFLLYDLRRARNNYALSMLLLGLTPVILYMIIQFFSLIFGNGVAEIPDSLKIMVMAVSCVIIILGFGSKVYGQLTEKRAGSDYLMIPASTTEKWISLFLVTCVAAPVVLGVLLLASDGLMSLLFPNSYGTRVLDMTKINEVLDMAKEEGIYINAGGLTVIDWMMNILTFTLGAICFKKGKIGKTILCIMGVATVVSTLLVIIFGTSNIDAERFAAFFDSADKAVSVANWTISIFYLIIFGLLLGGIWYRLRTIKQ